MSRITTFDGQPVTAVCQVNYNGCYVGDMAQQKVMTLSDNQSHEIFPASPIARWALAHVHLSNTSTTSVLVSILDGSTPLWETFIAASGGGAEAVFIYVPIMGSLNTALNIQLGASVTDVRATIVGYISN